MWILHHHVLFVSTHAAISTAMSTTPTSHTWHTLMHVHVRVTTLLIHVDHRMSAARSGTERNVDVSTEDVKQNHGKGNEVEYVGRQAE